MRIPGPVTGDFEGVGGGRGEVGEPDLASGVVVAAQGEVGGDLVVLVASPFGLQLDDPHQIGPQDRPVGASPPFAVEAGREVELVGEDEDVAGPGHVERQLPESLEELEAVVAGCPPGVVGPWVGLVDDQGCGEMLEVGLSPEVWAAGIAAESSYTIDTVGVPSNAGPRSVPRADHAERDCALAPGRQRGGCPLLPVKGHVAHELGTPSASVTVI